MFGIIFHSYFPNLKTIKMKQVCVSARRLLTTTLQSKLKICIVGAGPAGFYTAQHLIKNLRNFEMDMYEKLPVPFGLVRYGVAPDHPEVKNVINTFTKTSKTPHFRFLGNVSLGSDVTLKDLRNAYHVVVLAYGASENKTLNIKGDMLRNYIEARRFVGWYNGIPWDKNLDVNLQAENVAILGQGNVAIDVARILLSPVDLLKKTDITPYALEALSKSKVRTVYLVGRRGPLQAAFTIKELREMLKLPGCQTLWKENDLLGIEEHLPNLSRPRKRLTELILKSAKEKPDINYTKQFKPIFYKSPLEILGNDKVEGILLGLNELEGEKAILTNGKEILDCQMAIQSIGYKSVQIDKDIPFNFSTGTIKNNHFKVKQGLYTSGWVATGPTGVIINTMNNAFECANIILNDINSEKMMNQEKEGGKAIERELMEKGVQVVSWSDWEKIDKYEQSEGEKVGKPREKIVDIELMLKIASN